MSLPRYSTYKRSGIPWLKELPEHWRVCPLKSLLSIENGLDHKEVVSDEGWPVFGSGGPFAQASNYLYDGETILLGRKGTIDKPLYHSGKFWAVDTMYWTKVKPGCVGRFVYFSCLSIPFAYYQTSTALPSMTKTSLGSHAVCLPPVEEQLVIASFLDRETAKIDALIAEQQRLIELLQEKRQAVISHAVTKGLNPNVSMKDSEVEWLGEVPEHWQVLPCRAFLNERDSRNSDYGNDYYLSLVAGRGVIPYDEKGDIGNKKPEDLGKCKLVHEGDFVINSMNYGIGSYGVSRFHGVCSPVYIVVTPNEGLVHAGFAFRVLENKWFQRYAQSFGNGILAHRCAISWDILKNIKAGIPPAEEQVEILRHLGVC